jgi:hypothetical protein
LAILFLFVGDVRGSGEDHKRTDRRGKEGEEQRGCFWSLGLSSCGLRRSGQNGITFLSSHESPGVFFFYLGNSVFVDP